MSVNAMALYTALHKLPNQHKPVRSVHLSLY